MLTSDKIRVPTRYNTKTATEASVTFTLLLNYTQAYIMSTRGIYSWLCCPTLQTLFWLLETKCSWRARDSDAFNSSGEVS